MKFVVVATDNPSGTKFQYKIKDEATGELQNKGDFITEDELRDA